MAEEPADLGEREEDWTPVMTMLANWVRAQMVSLPAEQAEAIELVELQGLSQKEAAERVGVDPGSLATSVQALFFMTDDPERLEQIASGPMGDRSIAGSNEQIIDAIGAYRDQGYDEVIVPDFTLGPREQKMATLDTFITDVAGR